MLGTELDCVPRVESYMKGFVPYSLGTILLGRNVNEIILKASEVPGDRVMDLYMLVLKRL